MKLKKLSYNDNGEVESVFILTKEQYHSLVQHAISDLLIRGIITTMDLTEEEVKKLQDEQDQEIKKKFLEEIDAKDLYQA